MIPEIEAKNPSRMRFDVIRNGQRPDEPGSMAIQSWNGERIAWLKEIEGIALRDAIEKAAAAAFIRGVEFAAKRAGFDEEQRIRRAGDVLEEPRAF